MQRMKHVGLSTSAQRALDNLLIAYNSYVGAQTSTPMSEKPLRDQLMVRHFCRTEYAHLIRRAVMLPSATTWK